MRRDRACLTMVSLVFCAVANLPAGAQCTAYLTGGTDNDLRQVDLASGNVTTLIEGLNDPIGVDVNAAGTTAWIVEQGREVSSVDLATLRITAIAELTTFGLDIALNSTDTVAYATDGSGRLSSVDLTTGVVTEIASGLSSPQGLTINAAETTAYVVETQSTKLSRIDLSTGNVTLVTGSLSSPIDVTLDATEQNAFVLEATSGELSSVDLTNGQITLIVGGLSSAQGLEVNADETLAYVTEFGSDELTVVQLTGDFAGALTRFPMGLGQPRKLAFDPSGTALYVVETDSLARIDLAPGFLGGLTDVATNGLSSPTGMAVNADATTGYLAQSGNGTLARVNLSTGVVTTVMSGYSGIRGVAINAAETTAYVASASFNDFRSVILATGQSTVIASGLSLPFAVTLNAAETTAYVPEAGNGNLTAVNLANGALTTIATGLGIPRSVDLDPSETLAYVGSGTDLLEVELATGVTTVIDDGFNFSYGLRVNAAGTLVFVTDFTKNEIIAVDIATGDRQRVAFDLRGPADIELIDGESAAIVNQSSFPARLSRLSLAEGLADGTRSHVAGLRTPRTPVLSEDEQTLFMSEFGSVIALDLATLDMTRIVEGLGTVSALMRIGDGTEGLLTTTSLNRFDFNTGAVSVLSPGYFPLSIVVDEKRQIAYGTSGFGGSGEINAVNLEPGIFEGTVTPLIAGLPGATGVALNSSGSLLYYTDVNLGSLVEVNVDDTSGSFLSQRTVAGGLVFPVVPVLNPAETTAYVLSASSGTIETIDIAGGAVTTIASGLDNANDMAIAIESCPAATAALQLSRTTTGTGSRIAACLNIDVSQTGEALGSYDATLDWDPAVLQYLSFGGGDVPFDTPVVDAAAATSGSLTIADSDPVGGVGSLFVGCGEWAVVGPSGSASDLDLGLTTLTAAVTSTDLLPSSRAVGGRLEASNCIVGDVNDDLGVDSGDSLLILSDEIGLSVPLVAREAIDDACGDGDGDGDTDSIDANIALAFELALPIDPGFPVGGPNQALDNCAGQCGAARSASGAARSASDEAAREAPILARLRLTREPGDQELLHGVVELDMKKGTTLGSYAAELTWNPALVELIETSDGDHPVFGAPLINLERVADGRLRFADSDPSGANGSIGLVRLRLRVLHPMKPRELAGAFQLRLLSIGGVGPSFDDLLERVTPEIVAPGHGRKPAVVRSTKVTR